MLSCEWRVRPRAGCCAVLVGRRWSLSQAGTSCSSNRRLSHQFALNQNNFYCAASTISIDLLVVALICATVLIERGRLFSPTRRRHGFATGTSAGTPGPGPTMILVLLTLSAFFLIPIVGCCCHHQGQPADRRLPFSFGPSALRANWNPVLAFQDGAVKTWMLNSVVYARAGPGHHAGGEHPGRVRAGQDGVPRPAAAARHDAGGDADAHRRAGAADVPGDQLRAPGEHAALGGAAVLVLPVRGLPDLHLLLLRGAERPHRRGQGRRLRRDGGVSSGSRCRWPPRSSPWSASSASWPTGTTSFFPT